MKATTILAFLLLATVAEAAQQPNILFLFSDDHAIRTIGCYEGSINKTPNLDRIASEGALFTRSFNVNSICCPSRAAIMTGKHSHTNGITGNGSHWNGKQWVYMRALEQAGYQTSLIGKWHLHGNPTDEFQHWEILAGKGGQGSYYNPKFLSAKGPTQVEGHSTEIITDKALDWLEQRDPSRPFLLCAQYKVPHIHRIPSPTNMAAYDDHEFPVPKTLFDDYATRQPFVAKTWMGLKGMQGHVLNVAPTKGELSADPGATPGFLKEMTPAQRDAWHRHYDLRNLEMRDLEAAGKLEGQDGVRFTYQRFIKDYVRCIDGLDEHVGRILDYLDQNDLAKNTIVIYSSDQGFFTGEHGWAEKRWMYEESFRSPLMIRWPGTIKPGTTVSALVQNIDLAPTLLTAAGVEVPAEVHGAAMQPILGGVVPANWRKEVLYQYFDGGIPDARGAYNMPRHEGVRDSRYKLIHFYDHNAWEFYDLQADPQELSNRYQHPRYRREVERMKERLTALKKQYGVGEPPELKTKRRTTVSAAPSDGLASEKTDINARDTSRQKEADLPYLDVPIVSTKPSGLDDGIAVESLASTACDQKAIESLTEDIAEGKYKNIDSLLIAHKGKLVLETYYRRGRRDVPHYQMSITKSITSLALGRAIQLGHINEIDRPVVSFLSEVDRAQLSPGAADITIIDCLNMHSGIRIPEKKAKAVARQRRKAKGQGQAQMILSTTDPVTAGSKKYKYQGTDPSLVMQVIEAVVPGTAEEFIRTEVLQQLGISKYSWQPDVSGLPKAAAGSSLRSRDMLKLGLLIANGGKWNSEQLFPADFINEAVCPLYTNKAGDTYGYFWWGSEMEVAGKKHHCISARGAGGQFIFIVPTMDLIVVVTSHNKGSAMRLPFELMKNDLLPAFVAE
jgi:arylsulfatase A-like enzyme/CubicO group peptidase (beta-lactamase class C family)